jgi:hypothetical protein
MQRARHMNEVDATASRREPIVRELSDEFEFVFANQTRACRNLEQLR